LFLDLWSSFWVNPETQTLSHSFPKLSAALQRKFGTDGCVSRRPPLCVQLSQSKTNQYKWRCLAFCSGDATPLAESGSGGIFVVTHRT
jgi:hypothetical protein